MQHIELLIKLYFSFIIFFMYFIDNYFTFCLRWASMGAEVLHLQHPQPNCSSMASLWRARQINSLMSTTQLQMRYNWVLVTSQSRVAERLHGFWLWQSSFIPSATEVTWLWYCINILPQSQKSWGISLLVWPWLKA